MVLKISTFALVVLYLYSYTATAEAGKMWKLRIEKEIIKQGKMFKKRYLEKVIGNFTKYSI